MNIWKYLAWHLAHRKLNNINILAVSATAKRRMLEAALTSLLVVDISTVN